MSEPIAIQSVGSVYFDASSSDSQPVLRDLVKAICKSRFRRIDRFTELALLGAGRCVSDLQLSSDTALYLASGTGPAGINISMQAQIIRDKSLPSPIQFINSLTNSASFYVMKNHGLNGQNLFVSRHQHSFEAALELALLDLRTQRCEQALVGIVDEITHPLEHQYRRSGVNSDIRLGEGSHWFLLSADLQSTTNATLEQTRLCSNESDLLAQINSMTTTASCETSVYFSDGINEGLRSRILTLTGHQSNCIYSREGLWDGQVAGVMIDFVTAGENETAGSVKPVAKNSGQSSRLITVSVDSEKRYQIAVVSRS